MRTLTPKTLAVLRVVYIAFAVLLGAVFTVASVGGLWQGVRVAIEIAQHDPTTDFDPATGATVIYNPYGTDGPEPLGFYNYGRAPIMAAIFLTIGLTTLKRRWRSLSLAGWFFAASATVEALSGLFDFGWRWLIGYVSFAAVWSYIPLAAILIAAVARLRDADKATVSLVWMRKRQLIGTAFIETVLVAAAASSFLGRAVAMALSPEATWALDQLRGMPSTYAGSTVVIIVGVVGLCAAIALLVSAITAIGGRYRALMAALAFTAGLTIFGFLQTLDLVFGLSSSLNEGYALQEGFAFLCSVAALTLIVRSQRPKSARALAS